jgi:hypothetical protein
VRDRKNWRLADYLRGHDANLVKLNEVPLFLSARGTPLKARSSQELPRDILGARLQSRRVGC